ncbi:asparaginase domain-containing protein, partial [Morganella morganii]|uniref:asparaginase domain-containing protein n=1 Tax=Morganella morganii TaxID=582 RepID=UPI00249488E6
GSTSPTISAAIMQRQLALMPEFHRPEMPDFTIHEYHPLMDSSDMTPEDWQHIADDIRSHYAASAGADAGVPSSGDAGLHDP